MPGKGHRFSVKEDKLAHKIEASELAKGLKKADAVRIAWATINKMHTKAGHRKGQ